MSWRQCAIPSPSRKDFAGIEELPRMEDLDLNFPVITEALEQKINSLASI